MKWLKTFNGFAARGTLIDIGAQSDAPSTTIAVAVGKVSKIQFRRSW